MRRALVMVAIVGTLLGIGAPAATAGGYWACAGSDHLNIGVCLRDPVPDPLPDLSSSPD